jgi:glucosamine-phosphate N-acetyltransferase
MADGNMLTFRDIRERDHPRIVYLLSQLTDTGLVTVTQYIEFLSTLNSTHRVICCEYYDIEAEKTVIVGVGTVMIENKLIRGCGRVAHIEDIVVDNDYRDMDIGHNLIDILVGIAKTKNVYKVILNCCSKNIKFYEKCGFSEDGVQMNIRY